MYDDTGYAGIPMTCNPVWKENIHVVNYELYLKDTWPHNEIWSKS